MAFDLKPLTKEIIHKMNYGPHTLWIVKLDDEVFGPFEIESLKDYAAENEHQFETALASRMDTNDWQPFFSYAHFLSIADHLQAERQGLEKYWILNQGQKAGPLSRLDIEKKFELGILSMTDLVSVDDGHTWLKFFSNAVFNPNTLPATLAKLEVTACDEESTVPITLSAWIVPFIKEPPLPITICPLVNPLNVT